MYNSLALLKPVRVITMTIMFIVTVLYLLELDTEFTNRYVTLEWIQIHIRNYLAAEALYWFARYREVAARLKQ